MKSHRMILSEEERSDDEPKDTSTWFVYVLLCNDQSLYTGISNNPQQRLVEHQNAKGGRYTRSHKSVKIVYQEQFSSKSAALKREAEIKSWDRKKKIVQLKITF